MAADGVIWTLGTQFDLVPIRVANINGKAIVLLHRWLINWLDVLRMPLLED